MDKEIKKFCSLLSAAAGEPLIGSAGKTDVYFLLEYNGAWQDKAFEKSDLPEEVKRQIGGFSKSIPAAKILLIKRSPQIQRGFIHFFVVVTDALDPRLYRFELGAYEELLRLDLKRLLQGDKLYAINLQSGPLYLVCTNGRRDYCCARFGFPVYEAIKKVVGESVWECSHLGGHRFAPNVFHMPYGVLYGRVQPQDIAELVSQAQAGQIHLENLRGRSAYPPTVQAAEYYLRQQTGERVLDAYRLVGAIEIGPGRWEISFSNATGAIHHLLIIIEQSEEQVFESCALDKPTWMVRYTQA